MHKLFGNLMVQSDLKISMQGGNDVGSVWLRGKKFQNLWIEVYFTFQSIFSNEKMEKRKKKKNSF